MQLTGLDDLEVKAIDTCSKLVMPEPLNNDDDEESHDLVSHLKKGQENLSPFLPTLQKGVPSLG